MKIALIVRNYHKRGGISLVVAELAENYAKMGHEVHVFTSSWETEEDTAVKFHNVPILSFGFLRKLKKHAWNNIFEISSFALMSLFRIKKGRYDIVHAHGDYLGYFDVYTAHSCHKAWLNLFLKTAKNPLERIKKSWLNPLHFIILLIERRNYSKAKKIIAISRGVKDEIVKYYGEAPDKIAVVYNGVNIDSFNPSFRDDSRREIRGRFAITDDDFLIFFPAHEFRRKGICRILDAMRIIKDPRLRLLVAGKDSPAPYLAMIKDHGLDGNVYFAGPVAGIEKYFLASDALVFPTQYEPFGLTILEAMACGMPVITSKTAGAAELIENGKSGVLLDDLNDVARLADDISSLMRDRHKQKTIGRAARAAAEKNSWRIIAAETAEVYKKIAADIERKRAATGSTDGDKMNIVMFARSLVAHGTGGMEIHIDTLVRAISERGHRVTVITTANPSGAEYERFDGVEIYYIADTAPGKYSAAWREKSRRKLHELCSEKKFDVLHSQSAGAFHIIKNRAAGTLGLPAVVSLHGTSLDEIRTRLRTGITPRAAAGLIKNAWGYLRDRRDIRLFDEIIATSDSQCELLERYYSVPAHKIRLVYNGIDEKLFLPSPKNTELAAKLRLDDKSQIILAAARLKKEKGVQNLIAVLPQILATHPGLRLVVVGEGEYRKNLENLAAASGVAKQVIFVGKIAYRELPEYFNLADAFINSTIRENGYDLTILQAMACAKPVICSDIKSVFSVISDGNNGFIYPRGDSKGLLRLLDSVLKDPSGAKKIGAAARKRIVEKFGLAAMAQGTLDVYRDAMGRKNGLRQDL